MKCSKLIINTQERLDVLCSFGIFVVNLDHILSGFDYYHKIAVRVPNFWRTDVRGKTPKSSYQAL